MATSRQPYGLLASIAKHATRKSGINMTELNNPKAAMSLLVGGSDRPQR
jgi:hypothetical protein